MYRLFVGVRFQFAVVFLLFLVFCTVYPQFLYLRQIFSFVLT